MITPILDLKEQLQDGSTSIDLRLGNLFVVPKRAQISHLDPSEAEYELQRERYWEEFNVPMGHHFVLHPRHFALGQTVEWIHLPLDLAGYVVGRSTWGREGLIVATAVGVHPGWSGPLTLELTNLGEIPLLLYPGLAYIQLFLHNVEPKAERSDRSHFLATIRPTRGKPNVKDLEIIRRWND